MSNYFFSIVLTIHVLVGLGIIGLVLMQHGKGADAGAAFGSGASGSVFGASGSANFLSRTTAVLAAVFFVTSLGLSYLANGKAQVPSSVMRDAPVSAPAAPAGAAPAGEAGDSKAQSIPK
ncbi:preprotein translocase subunit SecG [Aromatoleum toluvorans]|uniref:Protein-export membrane protein SecG n=1 Tax=Aromatoleum toluvorans TaxID=92002 RepID=A0ABX1PZE9_9RHOO|nr:preprotein translocase subunit SecG [Aromatoleum toluvorans]NMG43461.1 preprotein translocase subunit SecG [Aromatoleum toluvorans]